MKIKVEHPEKFVSRTFYLLWQVCNPPHGFGLFQDAPSATEEDVLQNVLTAGDYPGASNYSNAYGDYVFGRMMKWGCKIEKGIIEFTDYEFRADYQSFCTTYKNNKEIVTAVCKSLSLSDSQCQIIEGN